jgi:carbonic anhydrase
MNSITSPDEIVTLLKEGNARFVSGRHEGHLRHEENRIKTSSEGQSPAVAILSCSDSRVPVEVLFDCSIGDIFAVRVAGNVVGSNGMGSIEYAVNHLGVSVVLVLGHTKCGAVTAAVTGPGSQCNIGQLLAKITPAVDKTRTDCPELSGDELVEAVVRANIWQSVEALFHNCPTIREAVIAGRLEVLGACYDIRDGSIEWMGTHPDQALLLGRAVYSGNRTDSGLIPLES